MRDHDQMHESNVTKADARNKMVMIGRSHPNRSGEHEHVQSSHTPPDRFG